VFQFGVILRQACFVRPGRTEELTRHLLWLATEPVPAAFGRSRFAPASNSAILRNVSPGRAKLRPRLTEI